MDNEDDENFGSLTYFLRKRNIRINLSIMIPVWLITTFNYYLIQFLINTFDQIY